MHGVLLPMRRGDCLKEEKAGFPSQTECVQTLGSLLPCSELCFLTEGIIIEVSRMEAYARPSSN